MRRAILLLLAAAALAPVAGARAADDAATYNACMGLARQKPDDGLENAEQWRAHGGGFPADHCAAIALIGLKQYAEAAHRLEGLAQAMVTAEPAMRAQTLQQAAEAWTEGGQPRAAEGDLTEAMRLDPSNIDLMVSRAAARADRKDYGGAIDDLNAVVKRGINRADVYAYRAAAYRLTGDLKDAAADADRAVALGATLPEAFLERANIRRLTGDAPGARQDWLKVVTLAPDSSAADAARKNLEALDVHPDGIQPQSAKAK